MPLIREHLIYKKKVELWLTLTGYMHSYALHRLLMKQEGRVAEYIMLTLTPPERDREDAVGAFFARLDGVILRDQVLVTQRGVKQLTTFPAARPKWKHFWPNFRSRQSLCKALGSTLMPIFGHNVA